MPRARSTAESMAPTLGGNAGGRHSDLRRIAGRKAAAYAK
jgi:hypothetical protein